jgi:hypothetical protein
VSLRAALASDETAQPAASAAWMSVLCDDQERASDTSENARCRTCDLELNPHGADSRGSPPSGFSGPDNSPKRDRRRRRAISNGARLVYNAWCLHAHAMLSHLADQRSQVAGSRRQRGWRHSSLTPRLDIRSK